MPSRAPGLSSTCIHSTPAAPTRCSQHQDSRSGATPFTCTHVHCAQISPRGAWTDIREQWCGRCRGGHGVGLGGRRGRGSGVLRTPLVLRRPPAAGPGLSSPPPTPGRSPCKNTWPSGSLRPLGDGQHPRQACSPRPAGLIIHGHTRRVQNTPHGHLPPPRALACAVSSNSGPPGSFHPVLGTSNLSSKVSPAPKSF